jgi:plasmid stabilization system protein ParE
VPGSAASSRHFRRRAPHESPADNDIRSFPFKGYLIFFRYAGDTFEVVNIIEGHRDVEALFK